MRNNFGFDAIGSIAILKFNEKTSSKEKKKVACGILKKQKNIKTVLEKVEKVKGKLRTIKTKFLAGRNTKETVHKENNCLFKLNIERCYFSPRLSEERKEVAAMIGKQDKVLVMFAGVGPFPIVIAKKKGAEVVSIELGKECCRYARENAKLNKQVDKIKILQGDVKKIVPKLKKQGKKFDVIVMPRPNLKETFLKEAFSVSRKGTRIFYYCFSQEKELGSEIEKIHLAAKNKKRKIQILRVKKAGDIAPYTHRWRADLRVMN